MKPTQGLPCMNCRRQVSQLEGKFFAQVFCCPTCFSISERLLQTAQQELEGMLLIMKEAIRIALIEQKLDLRQDVTVLNKKQLFEEIVRLDTLREVRMQNLDTKGKSR